MLFSLSVKMKASFEGLVAKAYNARATAIRLQSDSPMSHVQFVVDRKWVVPCDPWHRKYANEFIKIAYDLCKGKDRPYAANASKSLFIDESKSALYGSMEALYLEFSPLAGDRQQLLIHVIYNKSTQ